jgi:hypothetical protein
MKDRIKMDNIKVQHCPTEQMLADFLTKPLQGGMFRRFRNILMGYSHTNSLKEHDSPKSAPEERVGIKVQGTDVGDYVPVPEDSTKGTQNSTLGTQKDKYSSSSSKKMVSTADTWSLVVGRKKTATGPRVTKPIKDSFAKLTTLQTIRNK